MTGWLSHLVIAPIALPLVAGAFMLLLDDRRVTVKALISLATTLLLLVIAMALLADAAADNGVHAHIYLLGSWPAPFGIVLVADQLSTMMVALSSVLGFASLTFSLARWDRAGPRFHPLFMFLLMGVNGAFLTGDIFNLFVFFEVLLAASYGLVLHGSGEARVKAGLHYIAINLTASSLFLIGVSMIYGVSGTLNMADLAVRIPDIPAADRALFEAGCAILGVAFLIKAGMWPLGFWLPPTYSAAAAPAAAIFAIMTKVGVYIVLRLTILLFSPEAGASAGFGGSWVAIGGLITIIFGSIGILASRTLSRIASFCVVISSGTLLSAIGVGGVETISGALVYLISSTLAASAFFLLIELLNRARGATDSVVAEPVFGDEYTDPFEDGEPEDEVGVVLPVSIALIGGCFIFCTVLLAGLPPLSGFIGKLGIMMGLFQASGAQSALTWSLIAALTVSSFAILVAMVRVGVEVLWVPADLDPPKVRAAELVSVAGLLFVCVLIAVRGDDMLRYTRATVEWLSTPAGYVNVVLRERPPAPPPAVEEAAP